MFKATACKPSFLAGTDLFRGIPAKELRRLEGFAVRRHYAADQIILEEGRLGIAFFVVTSGRVRVSVRDKDGRDKPVRTIGPGGSFGEMALFSNRLRAATVTAVEPSECLALVRLDFLDELRRYPEVAIRLLDHMGQRLDEEDHGSRAPRAICG